MLPFAVISKPSQVVDHCSHVYLVYGVLGSGAPHANLQPNGLAARPPSEGGGGAAPELEPEPDPASPLPELAPEPEELEPDDPAPDEPEPELDPDGVDPDELAPDPDELDPAFGVPLELCGAPEPELDVECPLAVEPELDPAPGSFGKPPDDAGDEHADAIAAAIARDKTGRRLMMRTLFAAPGAIARVEPFQVNSDLGGPFRLSPRFLPAEIEAVWR
jgi:hypothetical protein